MLTPRKQHILNKMLSDSGINPNEGKLDKSDERKLAKTLNSNSNMFRQNTEVFAESEKMFHICNLYDPCPICFKCKAKASHLFDRCRTCKIPICSHTYKDMSRMIKRENRTMVAGEELTKLIKSLEGEV